MKASFEHDDRRQGAVLDQVKVTSPTSNEYANVAVDLQLSH